MKIRLENKISLLDAKMDKIEEYKKWGTFINNRSNDVNKIKDKLKNSRNFYEELITSSKFFNNYVGYKRRKRPKIFMQMIDRCQRDILYFKNKYRKIEEKRIIKNDSIIQKIYYDKRSNNFGTRYVESLNFSERKKLEYDNYVVIDPGKRDMLYMKNKAGKRVIWNFHQRTKSTYIILNKKRREKRLRN